MLNRSRGWLAVEVIDGEYTVIELLGGYDVQLGDVVAGNLDTHASETIRNLTQHESLDVFIQAIHCNKATAYRLLNDA